MAQVAIIDYGMGNLKSVARAIEECGGDAYIASSPDALNHASHIILPGVGAFPDGMKALNKGGWGPVILENINIGVPFLGICLGMQLMAEWGHEVEKTEGLSLIPGEVIRMIPAHHEKIPHVGWNELHQQGLDIPLFKGIPDKADFYFVHSFHFTGNERFVAGRTPYAGNIISVISKNNVYGVQFHPEKSGKNGFRLIRNFLDL